MSEANQRVREIRRAQLESQAAKGSEQAELLALQRTADEALAAIETKRAELVKSGNYTEQGIVAELAPLKADAAKKLEAAREQSLTPKRETIMQAATALDADPDPLNEHESATLEAFERLPPEEQRRLMIEAQTGQHSDLGRVLAKAPRWRTRRYIRADETLDRIRLKADPNADDKRDQVLKRAELYETTDKHLSRVISQLKRRN